MRHRDIRGYYEHLYDAKADDAFPLDAERYQSWLVRVPPAARGSRSLDIGCGVGFACEVLAARGYEVHGVDISERALDRARTRVPTGRFRASDETGRLDYGDGFFDLVICLGVLEHIPEPQRVVQETYRVLRPGGTAIFMVPNSWSPYFWVGGTGQVLEVPRSLGAWRRMFEAAGFRVAALGRDPGPSWRASHPARKKAKLALHRVLNRMPLRLTYQFLFTLSR